MKNATMFSEKQLRYLAKAIHQDVRGQNPYDKKNIFKHGRYTTNHLVMGRQFICEQEKHPDFISWAHTDYIATPNLEKVTGGYEFNFRIHHQSNMEMSTTQKVFIPKNATNTEIYVIISECHDQIESYLNLCDNLPFWALRQNSL